MDKVVECLIEVFGRITLVNDRNFEVCFVGQGAQVLKLLKEKSPVFWATVIAKMNKKVQDLIWLKITQEHQQRRGVRATDDEIDKLYNFFAQYRYACNFRYMTEDSAFMPSQEINKE